MHDLIILIDRNGLGFLIVALALIAAFYYLTKAFIERNKPTCECYEEEEDEEETVAMGGEEEDTHHEDR
jgi:hypothetical protein